MAQPYTWIEIDTMVMLRNVRTIRDYIGDGVRVLAVVKANAYGHGLEIMADALWRAGVDGFVVTDAKDALLLTEKYPKTPVLLLTPPESVDVAKLMQRGVRFAGVSREYVDFIKNTALRYDLKAYVHLEIETGLHRFGLDPADALEIIEAAQQGALQIEALFTHIHSDKSSAATEAQLSVINELLFSLQQADIPTPWVHVASGGALSQSSVVKEELVFDGVRPGRILFGQEAPNLVTQSPLTWKTKVCALKHLKAGDTVGYNATYIADRDKLIALLPVGYFDGLDRNLSNAGCVLIQGKRCPIVGRVCMNNMMIDVSPLLRPQVGDEVVLLGSQGEETISPDEMASWCDTIGYEVLARIPEHVPRFKVK